MPGGTGIVRSSITADNNRIYSGISTTLPSATD